MKDESIPGMIQTHGSSIGSRTSHRLDNTWLHGTGGANNGRNISSQVPDRMGHGIPWHPYGIFWPIGAMDRKSEV